jgi:prepilin-type N-terminal cleavage/methylation domain-containing protein
MSVPFYYTFRSWNSRHRGGFTLIELLVAISIIAVVIALAVPALRMARDAARGTVCASNLRTLGTAVSSYASSNKDLLPYAFRQVDVRDGYVAPLDVLGIELLISPPSIESGVVRTGRPFRCPSDPETAARSGTSYRYSPADLMGIPDVWGPRVQFEVTKMYRHSPDDLAIFGDLDSFHGKPGARTKIYILTYSEAIKRPS